VKPLKSAETRDRLARLGSNRTVREPMLSGISVPPR
jgi:hypothetical protein